MLYKRSDPKDNCLTSPTGKLVNIILLPPLTNRTGGKLPCLFPEQTSQQADPVKAFPPMTAPQGHKSTSEGHFPPPQRRAAEASAHCAG